MAVRSLVPCLIAVLYLRRSNKKQKESVERQREDLTKFTKKPVVIDGKPHRLKVIRVYAEDGISGDNTKKRHQFLRMVDDAKTLRDFQIIVCWDLKRFGRFDSLEAGYWTYQLSEAGVRLLTHQEGLIDWKSFGGRVTNMVNQENANKDLRDLSHNVLSGMMRQIHKGSWNGGIPYAYAIEVIEKPDDEKDFKRLVVGAVNQVRIVKRIFREYVREHRRIADIVRRLNSEGIDSPGAHKRKRQNQWCADAVKYILRNPVYIGIFRQNVCSRSEHKHWSNDDVADGGRCGVNPESDWIVKPGKIEAIISKGLFNNAQARLALGKTGRSPHTDETRPYVFPDGLLRCGRCEGVMWGTRNRSVTMGSGDRTWTRQLRDYECGSRRKLKGCEGTNVREHEVLSSLAAHLRKEFGISDDVDSILWEKAEAGLITRMDLPVGFDRLKQMLVRQLPRPSSLKRSATDIKKLTSELERLRDNLVILDKKNIPAAQRQIDGMETRLSEMRKVDQQRPTEKDINGVVIQVLSKLFLLGCTNQPQLVKPVLRDLLYQMSTVTVMTDVTGRGKRKRHTFKSGEFRFTPDCVVTGNVSLRRVASS